MMNTEAPTARDTGISRHWLLTTLLAYQMKLHDACVGQETAHDHLRLMAMRLGCAVDEQYRGTLDSPHHLSVEQFAAILRDMHADLQAPFVFQYANAREIAFVVEQCPWEDIAGVVPGYCYLITAMHGALVARHFGYARVAIEPLMAQEHGCCLLRIMLTTGEEAEHAGEVFTRQEVEDAHDLPSFADDTPGGGNGKATRGDYEALYHQQLQLTERLEQALEIEHAAAEQLRSFNRLKQDFLSNVSHEFRTPITAIQGYLSLLEQGALGQLSFEQTDALRIALRNIDRLNRLINDVLDFSALSRGQFLLEGEIVEVATVLALSLRRAAESAGLKGILLRYEPAESPGKVMGDEERLVQMVTHLLENAVKFSEPGQQVMLSARRLPHQVAIEIKDSGIGMTQEQLAHAFSPFVQGDSGLSRRYGGLGMGLSLIHNLVALHGGEINITSEPGQGTLVVVTLPLLDQ